MKIKIKVLSVMYANRYLINEEKVKILAYHEQRISISKKKVDQTTQINNQQIPAKSREILRK